MKPNPILERRRYVRESVYLLVAIVLAIAAQGFVADDEHRLASLGLGFFAVAVLLTTRVSGSLRSDADGWRAPPTVEARAAEPPSTSPLQLARHPASPSVAYLLLTITAVSAELVLFEIGRGAIRDVAWGLYGISIALGLIALWKLDRSSSDGGTTWRWTDSATLIVILLIAALFRLWRIDSLPWGLWYDEAAHGLDVERILHDPSFRPVYLETLVPEPALHWYVDSVFFLLFGPTAVALRISAVIAGLVGVTAIFFLGRTLFGWRTGVVAGLFLAVASWNVDFSRIMFNAIWSASLDTLAAVFLARASRTNRWRDYGLSGLCLGLGLNNYYTSRLFVVVVVVYAVYRFGLERTAFLRRSFTGLTVFALCTVLTGAPLIQFALLHPAAFNARVNQVSVFGEVSRRHSLDPLRTSIERHLLMFNVVGDPNGRHNLPSTPELDQVLGGLFVVGLALSVRRWRQPEFGLPLIWFPLILAGGIFSLSFEAPQSLRTIDNSIVSVLFAAVPLGALWSRLAFARLAALPLPRAAVGRPTLSLGAVVVACLFVWSAALNYHKYFVLQANDFASWNAFSTAETEIGHEISRLDLGSTKVYLAPVFVGQPTITFLAPSYTREVMFDPVRDLPLRGSHAVAIFLPGDADQTVAAIQRLYPRAIIRPFGPPFGGPVVLYSVYVSAAEVTGLDGLAADYYTGRRVGNKPALSRRDPNVAFDWPKQAPPLDTPFTVVWRGVLAVPDFGSYLLKVEGPTGTRLFVDEFPVLKGPGERRLTLARGMHSLRLEAVVTSPGPVALLWRPPGSAVDRPVPHRDLFAAPASSRGLLGRYFRGPSWQGQPALEQIDPTLQIHFHITPLPRPYSVEWDGKIDIPVDGTYRFGTQSIDSSWVFIDGRLVATNQGRPNGYAEGAIQLDQGLHDLQVKYQDETSFTYINVSWQPPGLPREPLPPDRLFPPQGAYPERAGPLKPINPILTTVPGGQPAATAAAPPVAPARSPAAIPAVLPLSALQAIRVFGAPGDAAGALSDPRGVAVDQNGNVYVVDTGHQRVEEFNADGAWLRTIGGPGAGAGQFQEPVDAVINRAGELVVLDSLSGWLSRFSPAGSFLGRFGGAPAGFYHPRGLAIDAAGNYYVADTGTSQVIVFNPDGSLARRLGGRGPTQGRHPLQPIDVAIDPRGVLDLTDAGNWLLLRYDLSFAEQGSLPIPRSDSLHGPHLAFLGHDLYLTDPANHRVIHLDAAGKPVDQLGGNGQLVRPVGLATDAGGHLFVADAAAAKVIEYGP